MPEGSAENSSCSIVSLLELWVSSLPTALGTRSERARVGMELLQAGLRAEVVGGAIVLLGAGCGVRVDLHAADRIRDLGHDCLVLMWSGDLNDFFLGCRWERRLVRMAEREPAEPVRVAHYGERAEGHRPRGDHRAQEQPDH